MNTDIRLSVDFFDHPKTIKLQRRLGFEGVHSLLRLWLFAAKHKSSGELSDMDDEEISIAAKWPNDPSTFVATLVDIRWLDVNSDRYELHDWIDHNGYASSATDRSDKSRFSRMAKTHKAVYEALKAQGYEAISAEEYKKFTAPNRVTFNEPPNEDVTDVERPLNESLTKPASPSPLPSPSPSIEDNTIIPPAEEGLGLSIHDQTLLSYNKFCPSMPKAMDMGTTTRWMETQKIFAKYAKHEGGGLRFLNTLFAKAEASDRITNRDGGWQGYRANLDWLLKEENYIRVIEGHFDNGNCPEAKQKGKGKATKTGFKGIGDDYKKAFSDADGKGDVDL